MNHRTQSLLVAGAMAATCAILVAVSGCGLAATTDTSTVQQSATTVGQYQKLELTFRLPETWDNPFDRREIELIATFHTPSGQAVRVPGFYYQPYERSRDEDGGELLTPSGPPVFKVRFAWGEVGDYRYDTSVCVDGRTQSLASGAFTVAPSASPGYVRRSRRAPRYFEFDTGAPYFAIGQNMCYPDEGGTYDYDRWMPKLSANGGNYLRLWLINEWNDLGLEHLPQQADDDSELGRYDQEAAWRIDHILDLADGQGLRVLMSIDSFNSLLTGELYSEWERSPYNAANGGPCAQPQDFFTNPQARELFRRRLRYLVGRWGYSTSVLAWEFWNEVDLTTNYSSPAVAAWHEEMARHLRSLDPWAHLLTTSFADSSGDPAIDSLPQLDFVQSHNYGAHDIAEMANFWSRRKAQQYGKPHFMGEFGVHWLPDENASDPEGLHIHNGIWASMLSGAAGTAMVWWWENYVDPNDLYHHYAPLAAFAADVDWIAENYQPAAIASFTYAPGQPPGAPASLTIDPQHESWEEDNPYNRPHTCRVGNDGTVTNSDLLSRVQHGLTDHPSWHNPVTFEVDYPVAGRFEVIVAGVSGWGGAALSISLDGRTRLLSDFHDPLPNDTETMRQYDGAYGIDVPPGAHTIVVDNRGTDWFNISYRLTNYITLPNLRVLALSNPRSALLWVQNKEHTWWNHRNGVEPQPAPACDIALTGFEPGAYEIQQWDTSTGRLVATTTADVTDTTIIVRTPPNLTTDIAYKLRRIETTAP